MTPTVTTVSSIDAGRAQIDTIDQQLVRLIRERVDVSRAIQRARLASGGPLVVYAREGEVCGRWRQELGQLGTTIARALLELGRGHP